MTTPHSTRPGQAGQPGTEAGEQAAGVPPQAGPYGEHGDQHVSGYYVVGGPPAEPFGANLARAAWPAFLAAGIGSLVVGILLLAWPKATDPGHRRRADRRRAGRDRRAAPGGRLHRTRG